jgi:hypothetical protein
MVVFDQENFHCYPLSSAKLRRVPRAYGLIFASSRAGMIINAPTQCIVFVGDLADSEYTYCQLSERANLSLAALQVPRGEWKARTIANVLRCGG